MTVNKTKVLKIVFFLICLVVLMFLFACVDSIDSGDDSNSPLAVIDSPTIVSERTSIELDGSKSSDSDGQIISYEWSIIGAEGLQITLENESEARAMITIDEIAETIDIVITLLVIDNTNQSGIVSSSLTVKEIDFDLLPPLPNREESIASIEGVDVDDDGVRDELEHSIYKLHPLNTELRGVLEYGAYSMQSGILSVGDFDADLAKLASNGISEFTKCLFLVGGQNPHEELAILSSYVVNTEERSNANIEFDKLRRNFIGRVSPITKDECLER